MGFFFSEDPGRRAYIRYEKDGAFWFNPVVDERSTSSSTPGFPCNRGDIFLKLGMRGARIIPWRLREGDVSVRSAAGYPFEDVDLSDGDWADYDVEADAPVALSDIETKVELVR